MGLMVPAKAVIAIAVRQIATDLAPHGENRLVLFAWLRFLGQLIITADHIPEQRQIHIRLRAYDSVVYRRSINEKL